MSLWHREEQRGDRVTDVLTDEERGLRLIVSRLGAEPVSLARRNKAGEWIGFLYRDNDLAAPATGWANHATVMGYFLHRLKDGRSLYRGQEIKGGTHSFLRRKTWHLADARIGETGSLTYRMTPQGFTPTEYPLRVRLDLSYFIENESVTVKFRFKNNEPELTAHVGFGLHPGFAATSFEAFQFRMPAGKYRRHFSPDNYLSGETEEIDFSGGEMPFPREQLPGSYILELVDVPKREFIYLDPSSGRQMILDLAEVPYLTLWSDGGPFLCVEPCWGLTDHDKQRAFEDKEGIQTIPAGGELVKEFVIKPQLSEQK
jgi:galactose mutarotase-like enzyme